MSKYVLAEVFVYRLRYCVIDIYIYVLKYDNLTRDTEIT